MLHQVMIHVVLKYVVIYIFLLFTCFFYFSPHVSKYITKIIHSVGLFFFFLSLILPIPLIQKEISAVGWGPKFLNQLDRI